MPAKVGVILANLGTPDELSTSAIRRYLKAFLSDRRVIDLPRLPWQILLNTLILPFRPRKLKQAYQKIWLPQGSPLKVYGENLCFKLARALQMEYEKVVPVVQALSYGDPSMKTALSTLRQEAVDKFIVLPLYPQFSTTTTSVVFDQLVALIARCPHLPEFHFIHDYHQHPAYIKAIANSIQAHWQSNPRGDLLLFSFHGLPKRYVEKSDPYIEQCKITAERVANLLDLSKEEWQLSFQSRFGKAQWVKPYTIERVKELPTEGVKQLDVVSPGFAVDCLETLEELAIQNKEAFLCAGGQQLRYIPALNDSDHHVKMLQELLSDSLLVRRFSQPFS